jgi:hypothetical protein
MNNLELTWLLKVRDALAEQDEVRRSSMLRAADRFLKARNQRSFAFRRTRNGESGKAENLDSSSSRNERIEPQARN